jgi:tRNA pseudouridine synthase 9
MEKLMKSRQIQKFYLTQVKGKFPDSTKCTEPIKTVNYKLGLNEVLPDGKESETHFKLINYNDKEDLSLVLCKPLTGRTHQIRVHLQHLGFPIINDPLYNSTYKAELGVKKQSLPATIGTCEVCKWDILRDPEDYELDLNLHAFEYRVDGEVYRSKKLPKWVGGLVSVDDVIEIKFESDNEDAKENGNDVKETEVKNDSKVENDEVKE